MVIEIDIDNRNRRLKIYNKLGRIKTYFCAIQRLSAFPLNIPEYRKLRLSFPSLQQKN